MLQTIHTDTDLTWSLLCKKVYPRLFSATYHAEKIKDLVTVPVAGDIVMTWAFDTDIIPEVPAPGCASISNRLMRHLGVSVDELQRASIENTRDKYTVRPLSEIMSLLGAPEDTQTPGLYVVTSDDNFCAAAGVLHPAVQDKLHDIFPAGVVILPSSIFEVLAVSAGTMDAAELATMVQTINATTVAPQDRLSDHVYALNGRNLSVLA